MESTDVYSCMQAIGVWSADYPALNVPQRGTTRTSPSPASTRIARVTVDRLTP
jgi:hypothetical protein